MSRYSRQLEDGRELAFGWDAPLASLFAQVFSLDDEQEELDVDLGAGIAPLPGGGFTEVSIRSTDELASQLGKHGIELDEAELAQLEDDMLASGSAVTPFQQKMMDLIANTANIQRLPRDGN